MRYAVRGAAGFIGSHLGEALQGAGHEVVGFDSFTDDYDVALKERATGWRAMTPLRQGLAAHLEWAQRRQGSYAGTGPFS